ncbi:DUF6123 family protein [Mesobacillus zeae]|uniref:Group-specific protein n=1 Tax=Mesobacillus zeae TaxID=1917180 RepID=A0A398B2V6_9BACI|nr:DUF6123 family protein [Mesobacillus zeae]RID84185.1 hypothetical protein D1970_13790 [Mesobacillus zeae]
MQTLDDYLYTLQSKGFQIGEDASGFIYFGKHYTGMSDELVIAAIEVTLKAQKAFDGSFYISLLETFALNKINTKKEALQYIKEKELLPF